MRTFPLRQGAAQPLVSVGDDELHAAQAPCVGSTTSTNLITDRAFLLMAWRRVKGNRGARTAGVDGQTAHYITAERGEESSLANLLPR